MENEFIALAQNVCRLASDTITYEVKSRDQKPRNQKIERLLQIRDFSPQENNELFDRMKSDLMVKMTSKTHLMILSKGFYDYQTLCEEAQHNLAKLVSQPTVQYREILEATTEFHKEIREYQIVLAGTLIGLTQISD